MFHKDLELELILLIIIRRLILDTFVNQLNMIDIAQLLLMTKNKC